jgi:hypothetical protein
VLTVGAAFACIPTLLIGASRDSFLLRNCRSRLESRSHKLVYRRFNFENHILCRKRRGWKISVSAATGIKAAERGQPTVIMTLDVAHSLADVFDPDIDLLDQNSGQPIRGTHAFLSNQTSA